MIKDALIQLRLSRKQVVPEHGNATDQKPPPPAPSERWWGSGNTSLSLQTNALNTQLSLRETRRREPERGGAAGTPTSPWTAGPSTLRTGADRLRVWGLGGRAQGNGRVGGRAAEDIAILW